LFLNLKTLVLAVIFRTCFQILNWLKHLWEPVEELLVLVLQDLMREVVLPAF
jgi:hypothetical protein